MVARPRRRVLDWGTLYDFELVAHAAPATVAIGTVGDATDYRAEAVAPQRVDPCGERLPAARSRERRHSRVRMLC